MSHADALDSIFAIDEDDDASLSDTLAPAAVRADSALLSPTLSFISLTEKVGASGDGIIARDATLPSAAASALTPPGNSGSASVFLM
jgi:hypothetical protein